MLNKIKTYAIGTYSKSSYNLVMHEDNLHKNIHSVVRVGNM